MGAQNNEAQSKAVALFVSDVHLQPALPRTTQAFIDFLRWHATGARKLYLLGDLFEYWAGDDDLDTPYLKHIVDAIREVGKAGTEIFWIAGNRDFLAGKAFANAAGVTLLPEIHVADIAGQRTVLVHGDAQCTDDLAYMAFRAQVRQPEWQDRFLAMPLAQRKAIIENMRAGSREAQRGKSYDIMDVNTEAIAALFKDTGAAFMIHGHTHRPADHEHRVGASVCKRYVLPDWDCDTDPPRGGWLAIGEDGAVRRFDFNGTPL